MIPIGFLVALVLLVVVVAVTHYSSWGWRQRVVGLGDHLALRQRLKVSSVQLQSMVLSGAIAGFAGVLELLGNQHRVGYAFSPGWGFDALAIALLAQGRFPAVLPLALYFGALLNGSQSLQSELALSGNFVHLLVGLPVLAAAALIGYVRYAPRNRGSIRLRAKEA
jgi:simple sugar transport system permease protein